MDHRTIVSFFTCQLVWVNRYLLGASRTAIFMNLLPVMTAALAISWLGEELTNYHLIGGGMTLLGVLLAQLLVKPVRVRRRARLAMATCRED